MNEAGSIVLSDEVKRGLRLIALRLFAGGKLLDSTFYILNYREDKGFLKRLPRTAVSMTVNDGRVSISNVGNFPAVGVFIENLPHDTEFTVSDNFLFLEPGEERTLNVNISDGISVRGLNFDTVK